MTAAPKFTVTIPQTVLDQIRRLARRVELQEVNTIRKIMRKQKIELKDDDPAMEWFLIAASVANWVDEVTPPADEEEEE